MGWHADNVVYPAVSVAGIERIAAVFSRFFSYEKRLMTHFAGWLPLHCEINGNVELKNSALFMCTCLAAVSH